MPNYQAPEIHSSLHQLKPGIIYLLVLVVQPFDNFKSCIVYMNKILVSPYRASVHHCGLRLGLSASNSQRFQYGFISNMSCDSCINNGEDVRHYIFFCPAFATQRQELIEGLTTLLYTAVMQNKQSSYFIIQFR